MGPGTCRKLQPLWIMADMMVSIMRAWGWDDLCKVMAAIQRLKRPGTTCNGLTLSVHWKEPSSFLILNLAPPWVIERLSDLASPPPVLLQAGVGVATCTPTCCFPPAGAMPPACSGSNAATRHQLSSFGPILLSYFLAQLVG